MCALGYRLHAWGGDNYYGELNVPAGLSNVVAIAAGSSHNLVLRQDGTSLAGDLTAAATGYSSRLENVIGIALAQPSAWH